MRERGESPEWIRDEIARVLLACLWQAQQDIDHGRHPDSESFLKALGMLREGKTAMEIFPDDDEHEETSEPPEPLIDQNDLAFKEMLESGFITQDDITEIENSLARLHPVAEAVTSGDIPERELEIAIQEVLLRVLGKRFDPDNPGARKALASIEAKCLSGQHDGE